MVKLEPLTGEHAAWLGEFLVGDSWPYHAGTVDRDLVTERLRQGYYGGPGHLHPHRRGAANRAGPGRGP